MSGKPELPEKLRALFWDYDLESLTWEADGDFLIGRILACEDWEAVSWLWEQVGEGGLRSWAEILRR